MILQILSQFVLVVAVVPQVLVSPLLPFELVQDMVVYLNEHEGTIYAPWIGQLQDSYQFYPTVHWVPMVDLVRPGYQEQTPSEIKRLLEPVSNPKSTAYILTYFPLEGDPAISFLSEYYVLEDDLRDRFKPLGVLPKRFNPGWPRYLYRYLPNEIK